VVKHYYPNLVDLHNYPAAQALHNKTTNWNILNRLYSLRYLPTIIDDVDIVLKTKTTDNEKS